MTDTFETDNTIFKYNLKNINTSAIGFVKFDGCMNWQFAGDGYQHLCDGVELLTHTHVLMYIYDLYMTLMENK